MRESESDLQDRILAECGSLPHVRLFRNNNGVATTYNGCTIRYGLMPGSADLIGWRTVTITPDMVGHTIAQFLSVEVKSKLGKASKSQLNWAKRIIDAGGAAVITCDPDQLRCNLQNL